MNPLVTVVCPTFNSIKYVDRAIDSLLSQTYRNFEVIFIDDGSTDNTVSRIEERASDFERVEIKMVLLRSQHGGPGAARNRGISRATGDWVAFLDSDDSWHRDKLNEVANIIDSDRSVNFISHWETYHRMSGDKSTIKNGSGISRSNIQKKIFTSNPISTSAVCVKKSFLKEAGSFNESLPVAQDYDLWLRLSPKMIFINIEKVLGTYYETPTSITSRSYAWKLPFLLRIIFSNRKIVSNKVLLVKLARTMFSRAWLRTIRNKISSRSAH